MTSKSSMIENVWKYVARHKLKYLKRAKYIITISFVCCPHITCLITIEIKYSRYQENRKILHLLTLFNTIIVGVWEPKNNLQNLSLFFYDYLIFRKLRKESDRIIINGNNSYRKVILKKLCYCFYNSMTRMILCYI